MEKTRSPLPRTDAILLGAFLLAMLLIGSFLDYPLSQALYNEANPFGMLLAAYGEYPAALGMVAAGTLLFLGHNRERKWAAALQFIGGALLFLMGLMMACVMPGAYLPAPKAVLAVVGLAFSAAVVFLLVRLCKNARRETVLKVAAALFALIFAEMILINLIKIPWGRPRMRLLAVNGAAAFTPWWQAGGALRDALTATGVAAEEFKSFPSGHTANAAVLLMLVLLPQLSERLKGRERLFFWIGAAWAVLVAFSRIIMGAHFLTDTTVGFAATLLLCALVCKIFRFRKTA